MAQTMETHGLLPLHSAILQFNQAIATLRAARAQKELEVKGLEQQQQAAASRPRGAG